MKTDLGITVEFPAGTVAGLEETVAAETPTVI